ncbi:unnamed protein product [Malus baccata var. baccata]
MFGPSDRRFDLNLGEEATMPFPDNIWRPSFISPTSPLTVGDSAMKNDITAAVVARNLVTPKDNRLLSKRSDELAVKDSLPLSVQYADIPHPLLALDSSETNDITAAVVARNLVTPKDNRLLAKRSDELAVKDSLALSVQCAVMSLKQKIRGLKHENKQLHRLAHNYATNMKRKIDQMQESDGQILFDHQRFVGLFQQHLPSSSGVVPRNEALNDQPPMLPPSRALPTTETSPE